MTPFRGSKKGSEETPEVEVPKNDTERLSFMDPLFPTHTPKNR